MDDALMVMIAQTIEYIVDGRGSLRPVIENLHLALMLIQAAEITVGYIMALLADEDSLGARGHSAAQCLLHKPPCSSAFFPLGGPRLSRHPQQHGIWRFHSPHRFNL